MAVLLQVAELECIQFSNLAKYGHGPPEDGLKETKTCRGEF